MHKIEQTIQERQATLAQVATFLADNPRLLLDERAELSWNDSKVLLFRDAALVGDVLGKSGWTRVIAYGNSINWTRDFDGVTVTIVDAEKVELSPEVPAARFPLLLEDVK